MVESSAPLAAFDDLQERRVEGREIMAMTCVMYELVITGADDHISASLFCQIVSPLFSLLDGGRPPTLAVRSTTPTICVPLFIPLPSLWDILHVRSGGRTRARLEQGRSENDTVENNLLVGLQKRTNCWCWPLCPCKELASLPMSIGILKWLAARTATWPALKPWSSQ